MYIHSYECFSLQPKYIHALKRAAERRKLEGELVYEHQAQKDIEKDAEMYKDKESFVTSAYKKKLEERRELEEELAREAAIEGEANSRLKYFSVFPPGTVYTSLGFLLS